MVADQSFIPDSVPSSLNIIKAKSERLRKMCGQPISAGGEAMQVEGGLAYPA